MALESGFYVPQTAKKVTHWPKPDANGDGDEVYEDQKGPNGESYGRDLVRDRNGAPVRHYSAPEGFRNIPSHDGTANYVKVDERGRPWRHPRTGEACSIAPGQTLVEHPNGDFEILADDYSRHLFAQSHDRTDAPSNAGNVQAPKSDADRKREADEADRREYEEWKRSRAEQTKESAE